MPEFEGFSIEFPSLVGDDLISNESNLPSLVRERASIFEQLYKSNHVLTPVSCTSSKYKIHKVPDVYQSLPAGLLEHINLSSFLHLNDADIRQFRESDEGNLAQSDSSFVKRTYSYSMPSSTGVDRESWKPPLTPPVVKFGQKVVSERSGASSEKVDSNPELVCFRIDENSSIENGNNGELAVSKEDIFSRKNDELTNRKALADITAKCENEPCFMSESIKVIDRDSLESVNSESYFRSEMSALSSVPKGYAGNKSKIGEKENSDFTVSKKLRKAALSLRNRSSRTKMSGKTNERSRSHGNLEKGCRPANMVSNISSFVPLVSQKQAVLPLKGRRDIKVKALEAAEAAKRLEVKKQNEREMRKAAVKLEREKAEQETIRRLEVMQKQKEEERKKKEADIAERKRLREEEGRKEKERKRRCIEETRRQKREQKGRPHAEKVEQKLEHKTSSADENEQIKKEQLEEAKGNLNSEKDDDFQHQTETELQPNSINALPDEDREGSTNIEASKFCLKSNDVQKMVIKSDDSQEVLQTRISINEETQNLQSYEMSPYKDSDDDDDGDETGREKKFIPFWARRDCLHQIIHSKQHLDPATVFCRKRSFGLNEVLPTRILRRPV
ncbi:inner centromere protein [Asparagus officinalis]|nr:inner centromere protein [Asparagus officinalis]XP_020264386.1 inner centromere protein [Asparagus officinalis]XP_020264387.1 inner centromere protein [Asparagus officinalis]XP_020264388.1 inner centromere protein [Asparagus officinalis]